MPFRKRPLKPDQRIRWLRWSIVGVATFAFFFSLLFRHTQYIFMFFAITGAIFMGGAGSAIIGGLYWKRGTTAAAWSAMLLGSTLAVGGTIIQQVPFRTVPVRIQAEAKAVTVNEKPALRVGDHWEYRYQFLSRDRWEAVKVVAETETGLEVRTLQYAFGNTPPAAPAETGEAPSERILVSPEDRLVAQAGGSLWARAFVAVRSINGQWWFGIAMGSAILIYFVVSLLGRQVCDMDRLFHRGKYAIRSDVAVGGGAAPRGWKVLFGITSEFTRGDRIIYYVTTVWSLFWILSFIVLVLLNAYKIQSDRFWLKYFQWTFYVQLAAGIIATVWLCTGGVRDLRDFFRTLATAIRDDADDGRVVEHHNVGEEPPSNARPGCLRPGVRTP